MHSSCMHENACNCANLLACLMHALHACGMHAACMPACMIHACSAGMHSLEGSNSLSPQTSVKLFAQLQPLKC